MRQKILSRYSYCLIEKMLLLPDDNNDDYLNTVEEDSRANVKYLNEDTRNDFLLAIC